VTDKMHQNSPFRCSIWSVAYEQNDQNCYHRCQIL